MFTGIANKVGPYLSAVLLRNSEKADSVRLCGNILSVLGLALILTAVFALDSKDFPGYKALLPVTGAVLMIAAGKDAFLNRYLLSNRVMVWFGLISYPLYIWHWPFLSFAWIVGGEMPQLKVRIGCVVLAVIMSAVTYYFVEPRLRWGRYGGFKTAGLLSVMILIGTIGYSIERHNGYTVRMNDTDQPVLDAINTRLDEDNKRCLSVMPEWNGLSDAENTCLINRAPEAITIALIGDSHSWHLYPGLLSQLGNNEGIAVFPGSCAIPLIGLQSAASPKDVKRFPIRANTEHLLSEGFNYIMSHRNIKKVVLSHHPGCSWNNVVDTLHPEDHDFNAILHDGFIRTYDSLTKAGKEIYVVLDNPHYATGWPKCSASVAHRPIAIPDLFTHRNVRTCFIKQSDRRDRKVVDNWSKAAHETAAGFKNIHFIDLEQVFCKNGVCSMLDEKGNLLYRDAGHLNIRGSIYAAPFVIDEIRK